MSNTPETDAAIIASNGQWSFVLKETCQRLERERDEAMEALSGRTVSCAACNHAAIERDEAREKAERYRLEANAMMLQRDEARSLVDHYREQKDLLPISWDV